MRDLATGVLSWTLSHEQKRQVVLARAAQEQFETRLRGKRSAGQGGELVGTEQAGPREPGSRRRGTGAGKVMRTRWRYLDECADDLRASVELRRLGRDEAEIHEDAELRQDAVAFEQYAQRLMQRTPADASTSVDPASRAADFLRLALPISPPLDFPQVSSVYSEPLPLLFAQQPLSALTLLQKMAEKGRLPTPAAIRQIVTAHYHDPASRAADRRADPSADEEEEAVYAHAREVLDEACSSSSDGLLGGLTRSGRRASLLSSKDQLEQLLQERLVRVERAEGLMHEPTLYLVRWLGLLRGRPGHEGRATSPDLATSESTGLEERQAALACALTLWEASQVRGRDEFEVVALQTSKSRVAQLFHALVLEACELEAEAAQGDAKSPNRTAAPKRLASSTLGLALDLAGRYMRHPVLVHHASRLLRAATVSADAPHLALRLFDILTNPSADRATHLATFTWTLDLLPTFVSLFLSSSAARDDSLPIRLYLSWTASGLSFPDGLWNELWRALGRRGNVDELARVAADWEETGRGQIAGRISAMVLASACEPASDRRPARVQAPLRLLAYFRSRYIRGGSSAPSPTLLQSSPFSVVPLSGYTAVLRALARSHADQRPAQRVVWRYLHRDGHAPDTSAYNALVAAHVWRPDPLYTVKDLDDAGVVYNQLIEAGRRSGGVDGRQSLTPDRETFSLLLHGFVRIAEAKRVGRQKRDVTLEAALRTFTAAADRSIGVRGHQAARLVRALARAERFEDAKEVQEKWWRTLVALEREWDRFRKAYGRRGRRGESMWNDAEVRREMREMRMARDDAERIEARRDLVPADVEEASLASPHPTVGDDSADMAEATVDDQSVEAFETAPLSPEGRP